MAFENVGQQWDRDEPWQTQQTGKLIEGLTGRSPWLRHQLRLLMLVLVALVAVAVVLSLLA